MRRCCLCPAIMAACAGSLLWGEGEGGQLLEDLRKEVVQFHGLVGRHVTRGRLLHILQEGGEGEGGSVHYWEREEVCTAVYRLLTLLYPDPPPPCGIPGGGRGLSVSDGLLGWQCGRLRVWRSLLQWGGGPVHMFAASCMSDAMTGHSLLLLDSFIQNITYYYYGPLPLPPLIAEDLRSAVYTTLWGGYTPPSPDNPSLLQVMGGDHLSDPSPLTAWVDNCRPLLLPMTSLRDFLWLYRSALLLRGGGLSLSLSLLWRLEQTQMEGEGEGEGGRSMAEKMYLVLSLVSSDQLHRWLPLREGEGEKGEGVWEVGEGVEAYLRLLHLLGKEVIRMGGGGGVGGRFAEEFRQVAAAEVRRDIERGSGRGRSSDESAVEFCSDLVESCLNLSISAAIRYYSPHH